MRAFVLLVLMAGVASAASVEKRLQQCDGAGGVPGGSGMSPTQGGSGSGMAPTQGGSGSGSGMSPTQGGSGSGMAPTQGGSGSGMAPTQGGGGSGSGMAPGQGGNSGSSRPFLGNLLGLGDILPILSNDLLNNLDDILNNIDNDLVRTLDTLVNDAEVLLQDVGAVTDNALEDLLRRTLGYEGSAVRLLDNLAENLGTTLLRLYSGPQGFSSSGDRCNAVSNLLNELGAVIDPSRRASSIQQTVSMLYRDLNCFLDQINLLNDLRQRINSGMLLTAGQGINLSSDLLTGLSVLRNNYIRFGGFLETSLLRLDIPDQAVNLKERELAALIKRVLKNNNL